MTKKSKAMGLIFAMVMTINVLDVTEVRAEDVKTKGLLAENNEPESGMEIILENVSKQYKSVVKYIEKAEQEKTGESIYLAELLVGKMHGQEKVALTNRINQIKARDLVNNPLLVEKAKHLVEIAEGNIRKQNRLKEAQWAVNELYLSQERTELVERLNKVHMQLLMEKEIKK